MTGITCVSVAGCRAPLALLERLAYGRAELTDRLPGLRAAAGAAGLAVLSTCQRVELYGSWPGEADPAALLAALAADRGQPVDVVTAAATVHTGEDAARHLLRVATGLESFVLGEAEVVGQVRAAAEASRAAGPAGTTGADGAAVALERLFDTAVSTARRAHQRAGIVAGSRSVAATALDTLASGPDPLTGRRLLVVGAGEVAGVVVERGIAFGARVTVCNRTRRHADQFAAAGAEVVDLEALPGLLARVDVAILATAAPHPLVDADLLRARRPAGADPLTLVDLALPRNVDPAVRAVPGVRLIDLADLRDAGAGAAGSLPAAVAAVEAVIEAELARYRRWSLGRGVGAALRRLRDDAEQVAADVTRQELAREDVPDALRPVVERAVLRAAHRLAHATTRELLAAAEAGDAALVARFAALYAAPPPPHEHPAVVSVSLPEVDPALLPPVDSLAG